MAYSQLARTHLFKSTVHLLLMHAACFCMGTCLQAERLHIALQVVALPLHRSELALQVPHALLQRHAFVLPLSGFVVIC